MDRHTNGASVSPSEANPDIPEGAASAPYPRRAYAWFVVGVLVLAALVSFVDRQIVALLVAPMQRDLGINDSQVALLFSGFAIFYAVAGLPLAYLADRVNRKWLVSIAILVWSAMTVACGLARNFWMLFAARIGVGIGEAALTPSAHSLIGDYFPRREIPLAVAVYQLSGTLGTGVAYTVGGIAVSMLADGPAVDAGWFGVLQPWQMVFIYIGAPGALVVLLMLLVKEPVRRGAVKAYAGSKVGVASLLAFYRRNWQTMLSHHIGFGLAALPGFAVVFWTPSFFERAHGIPAGEAGAYYGLYFLTFATAGTYLGAWYGQYLYRKGRRDWPMLGTVTLAWPQVPLFAMAALLPWVETAWIFYAPVMFFINSVFGMSFGALPVIVPNQMRAQVAAVFLLLTSAFGMGLGPFIVGTINDNFFPQPDGVRYSLTLVMCAAAPIWLSLLWWGRKYYAQCLKEAEELERDEHA